MTTSTEPALHTVLTTVSFARNAAHQKFLLDIKGECRGRYPLGYLAAIAALGGAELLARIEKDLGHTTFDPEKMYPASYIVVIFDGAVRGGVSMAGLGEAQVATFRRAKPWHFQGKTIVEGLTGYEQSQKKEATYGSIRAVLGAQPGRAKVYRIGQPNPCDFFTGVVCGLLKAYGVSGSVKETACQWDGALTCCYDVRWTVPEPPATPAS